MDIHLGTLERDATQAVSIPESVRRKHIALFGKSGVGKTTAVFNMAFADLYGGMVFTVIDPHGELYNSLAGVVPRSRTNDVIILDPASGSRVIGINVLESVRPNERHLVVSAVISIVKNLWPANWGPRGEWILEHCSVRPPRKPGARDARRPIVTHVRDPAVLQFFEFYESQNDRLREESIAPLLNKVSILFPPLRPSGRRGIFFVCRGFPKQPEHGSSWVSLR